MSPGVLESCGGRGEQSSRSALRASLRPSAERWTPTELASFGPAEAVPFHSGVGLGDGRGFAWYCDEFWGASSIVGLGWGDYAKLRKEKSAVVVRVLWVWRVVEGLTCGFWAVFEGGFGDLFPRVRGAGLRRGEWAGAVGLCPILTHDEEAVMNGAPGSVVGHGDGRGRSR